MIIFLGLLALLGFANATFLTVEHYLNLTPTCFLVSGCETVIKSAYSTIGPIPLALLGALFYLALLILVILYFDLKKNWPRRAIFFLSILGFLDSLYLIYLQAFVIRAYCFYCLLSAIIAILIFLGATLGKLYRRQQTNESANPV